MLIHNYIYSLRVLLKNRALVFWTLAFPLIMAVLFNMAFSGIESSEAFKAIDIAVIEDDGYKNSMIFADALKSLGEGEDRLFNISYTDAKKAGQMLKDGKITGYLRFVGDDVKITVNSSGVNETILCQVVQEIKSDTTVVTDIGTQRLMKKITSGEYKIDYNGLFEDVADEIVSSDTNIKDNSPANLSYTMIEYYSLIAMACLYSSMLSMTLINHKLANLSTIGKRSSVSPTNKGIMIIGSLCAGFTVQLMGLLALYLLMVAVLRVDFGNDLPLVVLLSLAGSLAGLMLGICVGVLVKKGEGTKITILISVTMTCCFLSGMMGISTKNIIDKNVPVLNRINPVAMITDGLYALYYYPTHERYWFDVISLAVFSVIMLIVSVGGLRRQRYDSI